MGSCLSKKTSDSGRKLPAAQTELKSQKQEDPKKLEDQETVKKEIFIIRHRKSHDLDRFSEDDNGRTEQKTTALQTDNNSTKSESTGNNSGVFNLPAGSAVVRTSSCTKEEVDAILIQCGRLSRGSFNVSGSSENQTSGDAATAAGAGGGGHRRKYSGSKRSYDFDQDGSNNEYRDDDVEDGEEETAAERIHRHRQRQRQSRPSSSSGGGRRRTPSRERDQQQQQQQRSGSRERNTTSSGPSRRVSRSPNRRSESPVAGNITNINVVNKPAKMVSVPATISSLVMDKSNNLAGPGPEPETQSAAAASVKRIHVKRNVSVNVNVNGSEPITRTAASPRSRSPARANSKASAEIPNANANANANQPLSLSRSNSRKAEQSPYRRNPLGEIDQNITTMNQKQMIITKANEVEQEKPIISSNVAVTIVPPNAAAAVGRTRSSRLSRDFDLNPETQSPIPTNPTSYTALLLEDIQNFHQKNSITTPTNIISLPPCLTKACSILEAVADLNSTTGSSSSLSLKKKTFLSKEPFVESEVIANDDIMEPSIHKYITVRRGGGGGNDIEEVESSGSNSFVGGQQHQWSSSWEPNSADSTDRLTSSYCSSRYNERDNDQIDIRRKTSEKKSGGVGKNRAGSTRSLYSSPAMAAATT